MKNYTKFDLFKILDEHTRECDDCAKKDMQVMMRNLFCPNREIVPDDLKIFREKLDKGLSKLD